VTKEPGLRIKMPAAELETASTCEGLTGATVSPSRKSIEEDQVNKVTATIVLSTLLGISSGIGTTSKALAQEAEAKQKASGYYCVMHPGVKASKPGVCPKCGMGLRPIENDGDPTPPGFGAETPDSDVKLQIPDVMVLDQDGNKLRFFSDLVKDRTVAINFIFTTCTTICPPLAATFRRVQQEMGDRVGSDIRLISISVDPVTDVPERLKAFSAKFKAAAGWTFITGGKSEIDLLLKALGAAVADKNDHTPMVLVGNESAGYWTRTYGLAPASVLVKVITDASNKRGTAADMSRPPN
jgi:cytochrome oxidase Cu insertion factor (SCO1/SenC/PrrC family)